MAAGEVGRAFARGAAALHRREEGTQSGPDARDVRAPEGPRGDGVGGVQDVVDVFGGAVRLVERPVPGGVGRPEVDLVPPRHGEDRPVVVADRDHRRDVAGERIVRDRHVDALRRTDAVGIAALVERADPVCPDSRGVDDDRGRDGERLGSVRGYPGAGDLPVRAGLESDGSAVVRGDRPVVEHGGAEDRESQACVVGASVPVEEALDQLVCTEGGEVGERLLTRDLLVAFADPDPAGQVVEPEGRAVDAGHAAVDDAGASEQRDEERQWGYQVGCVVEQALAFGQVLVDEPVLALLEVAEAAVDELGGLGRCPRSEVVLLDQGGPQAPARRVEGDARTGDAAADDEHVEVLGSKLPEGPVTGEVGRGGLGGAVACGHGPSLPQAHLASRSQ